MEYFNLTGMQNASSMMQLAQGTNTALGGYFFGWITLMIVAFVTFMTLKSKGSTTSAAFAASCWFAMIISWLWRTMRLIDNYTLWGVVLLSIGSVFVLFLSNN